MKRLFSLLIVLFISSACYSQTEHVKFMGIPINGTITQFQQKLKAEGFNYNSRASVSQQPGYRQFNGKYDGRQAILIVQYNVPTNKVIAVCLSINYSTHENALRKYNEFHADLSKKYVYYSDDSGFNYKVLSKNGDSIIGNINLFINNDFIGINYIDYANMVSVHNNY